jgi:cell division topological specificity factor
MALLDFLFPQKSKTSASTAKDRLQIIIARERNGGREDDFIPAMQQELIAVIAKYIKIDEKDIKITKNRHGEMDVLDVNVTIPNLAPAN